MKLYKICTKKIGYIDKKIPDVSDLMTTSIFNTRFAKFRMKYLTLVVQ